MQKLLSAIKVDLESGTTLAEALGKHPLYFDDLFATWSIPASSPARSRPLLDKIATYKEKTEAIKKKIKKA
jgi:type IV pilus assembly protein PilC